MPADDAVVTALEDALIRSPGDPAISLHLAGLLVGRDDERALELSQLSLVHEPANVAALAIATSTAASLGRVDLADQYGALLRALREVPATGVEQESVGPASAPDDGEDGVEPASDNVVSLRSIDGGASDDSAAYDVERPTVTLQDVGGLEDVKRRLTTSFLAPLRNPSLRAQFGKSLRGGLLLYGPPGCGKTFVARALAGEISARFLAVGLSDVLDMWLGESERKLHEIFELARRSAPCVLFFDEVDALGQKRSNMRFSAGRGVVSQLLNELDGAVRDNEGVYLLGATNHPWDVDVALRRPGRFDRTLVVLPPDEAARMAILTHHLRGRPTQDRIDLRPIAKRTDGFSGADLAAVCEAAVEFALEDSIASGQVRPITGRDLDRARRDITPSTRPWFDVAYNYATFANEGGQYDDLLGYIRSRGLR